MSFATHLPDPNASIHGGAVRPSAAAGYQGSLDDLLLLAPTQLQALYHAARVPELESVRGDLRGRMLANVLFAGQAGRWLQRFAASDAFPWRGKSFAPVDHDAGEGINRIFNDRIRQFGFSTFVGRSRAGDFDAVQLDYDRRENPWPIRMVKDEIRELSPGLYLGQAYFCYPKESLVLYFGLTATKAGR